MRKIQKNIMAGFLCTMIFIFNGKCCSTVQAAEIPENMYTEDNCLQYNKQKILYEQVLAMTADKDYKEHVVLLSAESKEDADRYAKLLDAKVAAYSHGKATLICNLTVKATMELAMSINDELPDLYPNQIYHIVEEDQEEEANRAFKSSISAEKYNAPNDPEFSSQWHHKYIGSSYAWAKGVTGQGVTVAVLDTGVAANHPDLNIAKYIDSMRMWSDEGGNDTYDHNGHGTSVAGIIAAISNNGKGGVGIAPDVTLISCKVASDAGIFYDDTIYFGVCDAVDEGADIISLSFEGFSYPYYYIEEAINYAINHGCLIVSAAGNSNSDKARYPHSVKDVIGVGAINAKGIRLKDSNYGPNVDIMAPGEDIYTTKNDGGYGYFGATSSAAPIVAASAALLISSVPEWRTIAENDTGNADFVHAVQEELYATAKNLGDSYYYGHGCVSITGIMHIDDSSNNSIDADVPNNAEQNSDAFVSSEIMVDPTTFNTMMLSWDKVPDAKSYEIFYSTSPDSGFHRLANTKKTFYKFSKAKCGKTYYFRIRTCFKKTKSEFGPIFSGTTNLSGVPTLQVNKTTYNSITLKWSKVAGAKKYEILYSNSPDGDWKSLGLKGGNSFTHKRLQTGATYYYQIRPVRDSFYGECSNNVSTKTILDNITRLKAKAVGTDKIKISWKKVMGVDQYVVLRSNQIDGDYEVVGYTKKTSYIDTDLSRGTTYFYRVYAVAGPYKTKVTDPVLQATKFF